MYEKDIDRLKTRTGWQKKRKKKQISKSSYIMSNKRNRRFATSKPSQDLQDRLCVIIYIHTISCQCRRN